MVPLEVLGQLRRPAHRLPSWRPGIRARLFLLALLTLSPLVGVLIFQDYYHLVAARQRADADATRLAQMKAGDIDQNLLAVETQLAALRAVVSADLAQARANEATLTMLLADLPAYVDGIVASTVRGDSLGAAWRNVGATVPDAALEDQVVDTDARRRLVVGQPIQVTPGRPSTVLASRAGGPGRRADRLDPGAPAGPDAAADRCSRPPERLDGLDRRRARPVAGTHVHGRRNRGTARQEHGREPAGPSRPRAPG